MLNGFFDFWQKELLFFKVNKHTILTSACVSDSGLISCSGFRLSGCIASCCAVKVFSRAAIEDYFHYQEWQHYSKHAYFRRAKKLWWHHLKTQVTLVF